MTARPLTLSPDTYDEVIAELESFGIMPEKPPSLEPMQRALAALRLETKVNPARVIIVAGTNGKGSVSATLAVLLESG